MAYNPVRQVLTIKNERCPEHEGYKYIHCFDSLDRNALQQGSLPFMVVILANLTGSKVLGRVDQPIDENFTNRFYMGNNSLFGCICDVLLCYKLYDCRKYRRSSVPVLPLPGLPGAPVSYENISWSVQNDQNYYDNDLYLVFRYHPDRSFSKRFITAMEPMLRRLSLPIPLSLPITRQPTQDTRILHEQTLDPPPVLTRLPIEHYHTTQNTETPMVISFILFIVITPVANLFAWSSMFTISKVIRIVISSIGSVLGVAFFGFAILLSCKDKISNCCSEPVFIGDFHRRDDVGHLSPQETVQQII
jgi:hypothetical protein